MNRHVLGFVTGAFLLFFLVWARPSAANGRFPRAQTIVSAQGGRVIYLRTTFGVLRSDDGGKTFTWICEEAMGFSGSWDPPLTIAGIKKGSADGGTTTRLYVGMENGIAWSDDDCTFTRSTAAKGNTMWDLTTHEASGTVFGVSSGRNAFTYAWRAKPGADFERLGQGVDGVTALSIDVAPSNVMRMYMTAQTNGMPDARLFRSNDGGVSFKELNLALESGPGEEPGRIYIAAVDPKDPDRFLVRRLTNKGSELWVFTEAGAKKKRIIRMNSAMYGFAKSPDGKTYWIASGYEKDGLYKSTDRGEHFTLVQNYGVTCLHAAGDRLLACNNTLALNAPTLMVSNDQGKSFHPLSGYGDIAGPRACDADKALCAKAWPAVLNTLGRGGDAGAEPIPPSREGGPAEKEDAGSDSSTASGGASNRAGGKRCGCSTTGAIDGQALLPLVFCVWQTARRRGSRISRPQRASRDFKP